MLTALQERERRGEPLRALIIGAGKMGVGIAWQVSRTPGMRVVGVADINPKAARRAAETTGSEVIEHRSGRPVAPRNGQVVASSNCFPLIEGNPLRADVMIEGTDTVECAAKYVLSAMESGMHVVLTNAEVDLLLGPWLHQKAKENGVVLTTDAGDQPGVLMRMIEEISLWGYEIRMAGNMKGFLDRYANLQSIAGPAAERGLNPVMCVAYTDGTKLNIEMALVANATGLVPHCRGMEGPRAKDVSEVFSKFDFSRYTNGGIVDYILGAEPGGGVFVVGRCDDPLQKSYMQYYKMGDGPNYLFYRPYHLCHLETPRAVALACLFGRTILNPAHGKLTEVVAFAKRDLPAGTVLDRGIGSEMLYGMIESAPNIERDHAVPVGLIDSMDGRPFVLRRRLVRDELLRMEDVDWPGTDLLKYHEQQEAILRGTVLGQPSVS
jgi:predicted homoserine dehydrogenase-like protein